MVKKYMLIDHKDQRLRKIAEECREFEHIINAMGYGYSLLNVSEADFVRRCSDCIHWEDSHCSIFESEIHHWKFDSK